MFNVVAKTANIFIISLEVDVCSSGIAAQVYGQRGALLSVLGVAPVKPPKKMYAHIFSMDVQGMLITICKQTPYANGESLYAKFGGQLPVCIRGVPVCIRVRLFWLTLIAK